MESLKRRITTLSVFVASVPACQSVFDFERGTPAPAGEDGGSSGAAPSAGRGGRNAAAGGDGASAGNGASLGSGGEPATGGSAGSGATVGTDAAAGTGASAGTGGTSASGGRSASGGNPGGSGTSTTDAGEAGAGGEAGGDAGPCQKNSDCPVVNPDCTMECRPTLSVNECVPVAADRDQDLHGSAHCEAAPGDDCDDTRGDVYPNAPELCDRVDNDCDNKRDFDDGQVIFGAPGTLTYDQAFDADIAWASSQRAWGTVWNSSSSVMYLPLDVAGGPRIDPVVASDVLSGYAAASTLGAGRSTVAAATLPPIPADHRVSLAWGEDGEGTGGFGLAFPGPYWDVVFGALTTDGEALFPAAPLTDYPDGWGSEAPDVVWLASQGAWGSAWLDLRDNAFSGIARTVSLSGSLGPEVFIGTGLFARIATTGNKVAAVWRDAYNGQGSLMSDTLAGPVPLDVAPNLEVEYPKIAAQSDRFGVVGRVPPDKIEFTEFNLDGSIRCGPVLREANGLVYSDVVSGGDGFLILAGQPSVQALEVLPGCEFGSTIELDQEPARFVRAANGGEDGIAVIWGGYERPLYMRFLGPNYCD